MLVLVGIQSDDSEEDINWLVSKIIHLRIFDDENGVMNKSILETGGEILAVSQFTLMARTKKGNRPSYIDAGTILPFQFPFTNNLSPHCKKRLKMRLKPGNSVQKWK